MSDEGDLNLICELRDDFVEEVPGCIGKGSSGKDYCRSEPGPEVTNSPSKSPITTEETSSPSKSPVKPQSLHHHQATLL